MQDPTRKLPPSLPPSGKRSAAKPTREPAMTPPDVVVFDCHLIPAQALTAALAEWFSCAEATASVEALAAVVRDAQPRVMVLSLGACHPAFLANIESALGHVVVEHCIVLGEASNRPLLEAALRAKVAGLVVTDTDMVELRLAIELVASGKKYISPAVTAALGVQSRRRPLSPLTTAQRKVMKLRQQGMTIAGIAKGLKQDEKNIWKRLAAGKRKFGAAPGEELDFATLDLG